MRRGRIAVLVTLVTVALVAVGCGGGTDEVTSSRADRRLAPLVETVRVDLEAADPLGAALTLAELRRTVSRMRANATITDEHAAEVLAAAARLEDLLRLAPTTTTTTTTTAPPVPAAQNGDGGENGNGKNKGKGKGND